MIAVCIPTLNEADTIGDICKAVAVELLGGPVEDLVVIDGGSTDRTPEIAQSAGARVVGPPSKPGKGAGLYQSVLETDAEIIVWCDGDLRNFQADCVTRLAAPLLADSKCMLVKGFYETRQLGDQKTGGGRTTWLMARPLLSLFFPELAHIREPLAGEYAIRRFAAERVPFITGYGVELGLLIDVARQFGVDSIAETNLGERAHKNQPLEDLSKQAFEILQTAIQKAGISQENLSDVLKRPDLEDVEIQIEEYPALKTD